MAAKTMVVMVVVVVIVVCQNVSLYLTDKWLT